MFYYVMEYLDGIDLQELVNNYGTQSEARAIHILLQICGSLFEAHSQGLVHRDIKPANVMLNRRGCEPDVVKVLDFGLVKTVDRSEGSPANEGSSMSGTPLYLSSESIQAPMTVDACSDIYAVGAVGYFLLAGKLCSKQTIWSTCVKNTSKKRRSPCRGAATSKYPANAKTRSWGGWKSHVRSDRKRRVTLES
ncbi:MULTISPECIES: serine/threonine-protein kinase [Rhodopirellula]|uniref:serine/threonine-protein kinase n=1 Tax=Rhodopirellula TaxID=265488 RepID=UPI00257CDCA5|nr:serine/threonine-protein kinase [Rhodopirellula sp. UBA1907]